MRDERQRAFDAVVIGAGFAGLSAAARLADRGLKVLVLEQGPRLGGRASAFTDAATGERVDNGQHVLFGCYHDTYAFLRLIGAEGLAPLQPRLQLPMVDRSGRLVPLQCPNLSPPWHLVAGLLRWQALSLFDRLATLRVGQVIRRARSRGVEAVVADIPSHLTVDAWLDQLGQPQADRDWLWHPLTLAALNQTADVAEAASFVRVVTQLFGPAPEDSAVGLARVPLDEMYAWPARRFIEARGGEVRLKSAGRVAIGHDGAIAGVTTADGAVSCRYVISAVAWHALAGLWEADPPAPLVPVVRSAASMASSPIVTVNLWFDGPVMEQQFVGLVDAPIHWIFNKAAIVGENTTHLAVVTSGADALAAASNDDVTRLTRGHVERALPGARARKLLRSVVVRERRATFSLAPGGPVRPAAETALPGFVLAGDWTDTGLPATIEGAVVSGHRAADLVLARRISS